jgi:ribose transport system substrate-binding protein
MMKKLIVSILSVVLVIALSFAMAGCKEAAEEEAAEEEAAEEEAAEEEAVEEEAVEEVVAEEEELYVLVNPCLAMPPWQAFAYGGQQAAKQFDNVVFETAGPTECDMDQYLAALETTVAREPDGIMILPWEVGEGPIMTDYYNSGGIVCNINGTKTDSYPYNILTGTDNFNFGEELANWMIEIKGEGEPLKVGIMTITDSETHIRRMQGIRSVFDQYPEVEIVEPLMEQGLDAEVAAGNASAFFSANPDIDAFIGTAALSGASMARAAKEAGFEPGEKTIICADTDPELIELIKEGYVYGSMGQSFSVDIFYAVTIMHFMTNGAINTTKDDVAAGVTAAPINTITPVNRVTKDTAEYWEDMPLPE